MPDLIFDGVVDTDYGQFDMLWDPGEMGFDGDDHRFFAGQVNGLVGAATGAGIYVNLARRSGGSPLRIAVCESEPEIDDEWEDVVEVSVSVPVDSSPVWCTWAGEENGSLAIPAGDYRVRVSARGRDAGREGEFADGPVDFYLVEFWPAPHDLDAIVRVTSEDAAYWHREWGGRRS